MPLSQSLMTPNNLAALSRQFGISDDQARDAMAALLPAFSSGLFHNANTQPKAQAFLSALSDGHHARYIEEPDQAASRDGVREGKAILGHLFGSKDVSRSVAHAAAAETGLGQKVIKKMLPVIASMVMGAIFKSLTGRGDGNLGKTFGGAAGGGLLGSLIEGLAGGFISGGKQALPNRRRRRRTTTGGGLGGSLGGILGNVLQDVLAGGTANRAPRAPRAARQARPSRKRTQQNPTEAILNEIFSPGPQARGRSGSVIDQLLGN